MGGGTGARLVAAVVAGGLLLLTAADSVAASVVIAFVASAFATPLSRGTWPSATLLRVSDPRRAPVYRLEPLPDTVDGAVLVDGARMVPLRGEELLGQPAGTALNLAAVHDLLDRARRERSPVESEIGVRQKRLLLRAEPLDVPAGPLLVTFRDLT